MTTLFHLCKVHVSLHSKSFAFLFVKLPVQVFLQKLSLISWLLVGNATRFLANLLEFDKYDTVQRTVEESKRILLIVLVKVLRVVIND